MIGQLIDKGADMNVINNDKNSALIYAIVFGKMILNF